MASLFLCCAKAKLLLAPKGGEPRSPPLESPIAKCSAGIAAHLPRQVEVLAMTLKHSVIMRDCLRAGLVMRNKIFAYSQYFVPKHFFSALMGRLAACHIHWLKNYLIRRFIAKYSIDMRETIQENAESYANFNQFFIRQLKPQLRPVATDPSGMVSPVDGSVAAIGHIRHNLLLQAKNQYFTLETLVGNDHQLAKTFAEGSFATLYLAPHNYHRVHMPLTGTLQHTLYVPGNLFSVNRITADLIPNLYARNERLITVFHTEAGPMAVIFVGALIVGGIKTIWMPQPIRDKRIKIDHSSAGLVLPKGAELGHFQLGSTVLLLFCKEAIHWAPEMTAGHPLKFGQKIGNIAL